MPKLSTYALGSPEAAQVARLAATKVSLTADTDIAAGTAASLNASGHAVQSWGPAPAINDVVTMFADQAIINDGTAKPTFLPLSANAFVAFVISSGASQFGAAQPATISGNVITLGTESTAPAFQNMMLAWNMPNRSRPSAVGISGSLFVVAYNDPDSGNLNAVACSISGGVITLGSPIEVDTASGENALVLALDSTHFAVSYLNDNDGNGYAVVGSLSGTTITLGTPALITNSFEGHLFSAPLSATKIGFAWLSSAHINIAVGSISGTTLSVDSPVAGTASLKSFNAVVLSGTSMLYEGVGTTEQYRGFLGAVSISGTTPTVGEPIIVGPQTGGGFLTRLDDTHGLVSGLSQNNAPVEVEVSGTSVSILSAVALFAPGGTTGLFGEVVPIGSTSWMFTDSQFSIYQQNEDQLSGPITHPSVIEYWLYPLDSSRVLATIMTAKWRLQARVINKAADINYGPFGFAENAVTSGQSGAFTVAGIAAGFTGLTPGARYFVNGDGTLTTTETGHPAGYAVSATQLAIVPAP